MRGLILRKIFVLRRDKKAGQIGSSARRFRFGPADREAKKIEEMIRGAKNPLAFCIGEFSFGINPGRPKNVSRSIVAEKLDRSIHIAIGTNQTTLKASCPEIGLFPHGRYSAGVHIDCIKFGASVKFRPEIGGKFVDIL